MTSLRFVDGTYIRTTPRKPWQAGTSWKLMIPDGRIGDAVEFLEVEPCRWLLLSRRGGNRKGFYPPYVGR